MSIKSLEKKCGLFQFLNKINSKDSNSDKGFGIIVLTLLTNASKQWQYFYRLFMFLFCVSMWLKSIFQTHIFS